MSCSLFQVNHLVELIPYFVLFSFIINRVRCRPASPRHAEVSLRAGDDEQSASPECRQVSKDVLWLRLDLDAVNRKAAGDIKPEMRDAMQPISDVSKTYSVDQSSSPEADTSGHFQVRRQPTNDEVSVDEMLSNKHHRHRKYQPVSTCTFEPRWEKTPDDVFPPLVLSGRCADTSGFGRMYSCIARRYVIKVFRRVPRRCNALPTFGVNSTYEDVWNLVDYHVNVGCDCQQRRNAGKYVVTPSSSQSFENGVWVWKIYRQRVLTVNIVHPEMLNKLCFRTEACETPSQVCSSYQGRIWCNHQVLQGYSPACSVFAYLWRGDVMREWHNMKIWNILYQTF